MTSLQKAALASSSQRQPENTRRSTKGSFRGSGVFETSFGGLDLSEFENTSANSNNNACASARLIKAKTVEAQRAAMEAKEEYFMREQAAQKMLQEEERSKRQKEEEEMVERGSTLLLPPPTTVAPSSCCASMEEQDPFYYLRGHENNKGKSDGKEFMSNDKKGMYSALVQMHRADQHGGAKTPATPHYKENKRIGSPPLESLQRQRRRSRKPQRTNALLTKAALANKTSSNNKLRQKGNSSNNTKRNNFGTIQKKQVVVKKMRKTKH